MLDHSESAKLAGDVASWGLVIGTLFQYLPQIAAGLSTVWTVYRGGESIYDRHFQKWNRPSVAFSYSACPDLRILRAFARSFAPRLFRLNVSLGK